MEKPTISVIIPIHNGCDFIENCIQSILKQTYPQVEIVIVENGSTDGTIEKCDLLQKQYSELKIFHIPLCGVSAARNYGIQRATGSYLTFVDADDQIEPDMLERLFAAILRDQTDIAGCEFREHAQEKDLHLSGREFAEQRIFYGDSRCWSKLYSRAVIGETRFLTDYTIGEDMLFLLELALKPGVTISCLSYKGYRYYVNPKGAMQRAFQPSFMDQISCWRFAKQMMLQSVSQQPEQSVSQLMEGSASRVSEQLLCQMNALILTAVVLVAQKLAGLTGDERKENRCYIKSCLTFCSELRAQDNVAYRHAVKAISKQHRMELWMFIHATGGYLWLRRKLS